MSLQTWQRDRHSGARRASVQVGKGGVLAAMAQCERSAACYREALRIRPEYPDALFGLATVTSGKQRKLPTHSLWLLLVLVLVLVLLLLLRLRLRLPLRWTLPGCVLSMVLRAAAVRAQGCGTSSRCCAWRPSTSRASR